MGSPPAGTSASRASRAGGGSLTEAPTHTPRLTCLHARRGGAAATDPPHGRGRADPSNRRPRGPYPPPLTHTHTPRGKTGGRGPPLTLPGPCLPVTGRGIRREAVRGQRGGQRSPHASLPPPPPSPGFGGVAFPELEEGKGLEGREAGPESRRRRCPPRPQTGSARLTAPGPAPSSPPAPVPAAALTGCSRRGAAAAAAAAAATGRVAPRERRHRRCPLPSSPGCRYGPAEARGRRAPRRDTRIFGGAGSGPVARRAGRQLSQRRSLPTQIILGF